MQQDIAPAPAPPAVPTVAPPARKRIGEILIERGRLDAAGLDPALRLPQETHEKIRGLPVPPRPVGERARARAPPPHPRLPLIRPARPPRPPHPPEHTHAPLPPPRA